MSKIHESLMVNEILTAYAAMLSYEIEKSYKSGKKDSSSLEKVVSSFQSDKPLEKTTKYVPQHLTYLDSYYDSATGASAVALKDTHSGKVIIAYTGSNDWKDWTLANFTGIGLGTGIHIQSAYNFYEDIRFRFGDKIMLTGHSMGGNVA